jgi:4-hydroxy-tetrahydrodipicolinate reductase
MVAPPNSFRGLPFMRVGIAGVEGRVGRLLVEEVRRAGICLAGGTARPGTGRTFAGTDVRLFNSLDDLAVQAEVVIDFTHPDATAAHAAILARSGSAWVLGTTGLSAQTQKAVETAARRVPVVQAANFSPGVTLVLGLAARMAAALPAEEYDAEILEMHHRQKIDAPSGTALAIGEAVVQGRGDKAGSEREFGRHGHTGPRKAGAIGFAALRGGQIVGEHTLLFTSGSEQISLTHRAFDRRVFASGAVRAALWAEGRPPGLYGMEDVLGLR